MFERISRVALGAALIVVVASCSEQVTGSLGCPDLCADQSTELRDTVLVGSVVSSATLMGFPQPGTTPAITLVARGDTADVRLAVRYDTLPVTYFKTDGGTDTIRVVDSAHMVFIVDTTFKKPTVPIRIDAFDVDTTADGQSSVIPLYRADRLIGSQVYQPGEVKDTMRLPLSNAAVLAKITARTRLRIGLRVSAASSVQLRVDGTNLLPIVRFRASVDTAVRFDTLFVRSKTPANDVATASGFVMYSVLVSGVLPEPPASVLAVGGISGARSYLKFDIPDIVLDSVRVVRATIQLNQLPSRYAGGTDDSLTLSPLAIVAVPSITDLPTLATFSVAAGTPSLFLKASESGLKELEIGRLVASWKATGSATVNRAVFLRVTQEGVSPGELNFSSVDAPAALRPRLRLIYVPRRGFGLP